MAKGLKMLLYGYGGHGRVIADSLQDAGIAVVGVFDDRPLSHCPFPFLGKYAPDQYPEYQILLAIGDNSKRKRLAESIAHPTGILLHASAQISRQAKVATGSVILQRAIIQTGVAIGRHCIINSGAIIEHDCRLSDFVHIAPGAILCGDVSVGEGSLVGAGAVVLPGVSIGKNCIVGAGSVLTASLPDGLRCCGNPARPF